MQLSASVAETAPPSEKRLAAALQHRYFLRLHMTAILAATILVGLGLTRLLFALGVIFAVRYAIAVLGAYAAFVGFVKLWLAYISARGGNDWLDSVNFSGGGSSSSSSASSSSGSSFGSGGGKFGGAGASGNWDEAAPKAAIIAPPPVKSSGGSKSSSGGSDDLGELVLVFLIIALVVAILASFAWLVWAAPGILSETAFNAALAGVLTPHAHKAAHGNWIGSVLKKTAIPFVLIFGLAIAAGAWAQHICPQAHRLADAMNCAR